MRRAVSLYVISPQFSIAPAALVQEVSINIASIRDITKIGDGNHVRLGQWVPYAEVVRVVGQSLDYE